MASTVSSTRCSSAKSMPPGRKKPATITLVARPRILGPSTVRPTLATASTSTATTDTRSGASRESSRRVEPREILGVLGGHAHGLEA